MPKCMASVKVWFVMDKAARDFLGKLLCTLLHGNTTSMYSGDYMLLWCVRYTIVVHITAIHNV